MRPTDLLLLLQLLRNQWKSPEEIKSIQDRKLRRLVEHAYANVPYYQRLFDTTGLKPADIRRVEDLPKIPATSKRQVSRLPREEIVAKGIAPNRCRYTRSSGATGTPLSISHRRKDLTLTNFAFLRAYMAHGFKPWQKKVEFTGSRNVPKGQSWYEYLGLMRRKVFSDADEPGLWISELQTWRPHALIGYVMMLKQLAMAIQEQQITTIRPTVVFSTSAVLDESTRQLLQSVFRARVVDIYASEEGRCIAWECDHCPGYHINADLLIVEVLKKNGEPAPLGTEGEIAITNLHSFATPFIRYRLGDVGVLAKEQPTCGRGLPLLKRIEGRIDDFITLTSGRKLSPRLFYYALWSVPGITEFRLTQQRVDRLEVEIVTTKEFDHRSQELMFDNLRQLVGNDVEIIPSVVSFILRGPSEKFQSFISMVDKVTPLSEAK